VQVLKLRDSTFSKLVRIFRIVPTSTAQGQARLASRQQTLPTFKGSAFPTPREAEIKRYFNPKIIPNPGSLTKCHQPSKQAMGKKLLAS
jgi:hypothetical protein